MVCTTHLVKSENRPLCKQGSLYSKGVRTRSKDLSFPLDLYATAQENASCFPHRAQSSLSLWHVAEGARENCIAGSPFNTCVVRNVSNSLHLITSEPSNISLFPHLKFQKLCTQRQADYTQLSKVQQKNQFHPRVL